MAQGLNNSQACRQVGVNRKTGNRWTYGRTIIDRTGRAHRYEPITKERLPISSRFLSEEERVTIADLRRAGQSVRAIARTIGRDPATVSREIRRNGDPDTGAYHPYRAQRRATARRSRAKEGKLRTNPQLRGLVQDALDQLWSPEQISCWLRHEFPDQRSMQVSHETIYQALYQPGRDVLRRDPATTLRTGRRCRRRRRRGVLAQQRNRYITPGVHISQRPVEATDRIVPGHWEGDLICGTSNRSAIGTLVERSTRYVILLHLDGGRGAEHVRDALLRELAVLPAGLVRSLTWDQGSEMGRHDEFTTASSVPVYFCDPASPWQRGSNENTNGLLRQYFPKGTDLAVYSAEDLATVTTQLNRRPRKILGWDSPATRFAKLVATAN